MRRVVITGVGILSPIGNSLDAVEQALTKGTSGIRCLPEWKTCKGLRSLVGGRVDGIDPKALPRSFRRTMGRVALLATLAARDATANAQLDQGALDSARTAVVFGSTTGSTEIFEACFADYFSRGGIELMEGTLFMKMMSHTVAANVAAFLGVKGRVLSPCSACASSTQAIGLGYEMIREGLQDIAICGGAEELHPLTAGVFDVLHAASKKYNDSPQKTPRPFDAGRDGLVVSEGAAAVVLEEYKCALTRGAHIHGEVVGYATCADIRNMTSPGRDGMVRCMQDALNVAGLKPRDLDYINAHATGTEVGDPAEAAAIYEVVGDSVPVSATKGFSGHTLAACGAMEAIFCLVMMQRGFLAPTLNLEQVCPECSQINHVRTLVHAHPQKVMSNNFAFGGINASLVLGKT